MDGAYPLYGTLVARAGDAAAGALAARDGVFGAAVDSRCWRGSTSRSATGSSVGNAPIEIRAVLRSEPDKLAGGIGFGPRLLVSEEALARHRTCCSPAAWCAGTIACA